MYGESIATILVSLAGPSGQAATEWRVSHILTLAERKSLGWLLGTAMGGHGDPHTERIYYLPEGNTLDEQLVCMVAHGCLDSRTFDNSLFTHGIDLQRQCAESLPMPPDVVDTAVVEVAAHARLGVINLSATSGFTSKVISALRDRGIQVDSFESTAVPISAMSGPGAS